MRGLPFFFALFAVIFFLSSRQDLAQASGPASHANTHAHPLPIAEGMLEIPALDLTSLATVKGILPRLEKQRAIFIGERHTQFADHLVQLAIIKGLHDRGVPLAIGMEQFQFPFQHHLDAYIAREIDEKMLLRETEYFQRWGFDYRLYQPILHFAREHGIPLLALNLPNAIPQTVAQEGRKALTFDQQRMLPEKIECSDSGYKARLRKAFEKHPKSKERDFEDFWEAQLLRDETMAERVAHYLEQHPHRTIVVLAGRGHIAYGSGIPGRVERRLELPTAILLSGLNGELSPAMADFILLPREASLPPKGRLGTLLTEADGLGVNVEGFTKGSTARAAGIEEGDRIIRLDKTPIHSPIDVRLAMLGSQPGEQITVKVMRKGSSGNPQPHTYEVTLEASSRMMDTHTER